MSFGATVLHWATEPIHFLIRSGHACDHGPISSEHAWIREVGLGLPGHRAGRQRYVRGGEASRWSALDRHGRELLKTLREEGRSPSLTGHLHPLDHHGRLGPHTSKLAMGRTF